MSNQLLTELQNFHQPGGYISTNPEVNIAMLTQLRAMYAELQHALERIASGEPDPVAIASAALHNIEDDIEEP